MLAGVGPVQEVAVDQLAGEPDPYPAAGRGGLVQPGRDQVVEGAGKVGERYVDRDPGARQPVTDRLILGGLRHGSVLPDGEDDIGGSEALTSGVACARVHERGCGSASGRLRPAEIGRRERGRAAGIRPGLAAVTLNGP